MIVDVIGVSGVIIVVATYMLLQIDKIDAKGFWYSFLNAIGSVMILYSLTYNWNLASIIIEFFWIAISLFGLWKWNKTRNKVKKTES